MHFSIGDVMPHRTHRTISKLLPNAPTASQEARACRESIAIIAGVAGDGGSFLARNLAALISEKLQPIPLSVDLSPRLPAEQSATDAHLFDCPPGYQAVASVARLRCQQVVLCASPRPDSIVNVYAIIKALHQMAYAGRMTLVFNRATPRVGQEFARRVNSATEQFLGRALNYGGVLPFDRRLVNATPGMPPVVLRWPRAPISLALRHLGGELGLAQPVRRPVSDAWSRVAALFL